MSLPTQAAVTRAVYNGNTAIRGRHYEQLASEFDAFVKKIEHNDWYLPDRR